MNFDDIIYPTRLRHNIGTIFAKNIGTIFVDLPKAFDTLNTITCQAKYILLFFNVIKFVQGYLSERFQRVKRNTSFSKWYKILI